MGDMITIPVSATMQKQPDGSFKMVDAEYRTVEADVIARFLMERFGVPFGEEAKPS